MDVTQKRAGIGVDRQVIRVPKTPAWRRDYPKAFNRDYDLATGASLSGWLKA